MEERKVKIFSQLPEGQYPEYLFWVGCMASYDAVAARIARAFTQILLRSGVDFGILGEEETCTADAARRAGNEYVFEVATRKIIGIFERYGVKKILTICPHCFHVFKNEYLAFGKRYEVLHHTEFLSQMLDSGEIKLKKRTDFNNFVTYHDPCYLARANGVVKEPRELLRAMGKVPKEPAQSDKDTFCCGAGGARYFIGSDALVESPADIRLAQLERTGACEAITACPFCLSMLTQASGRTTKDGDDFPLRDISELVLDAME